MCHAQLDWTRLGSAPSGSEIKYIQNRTRPTLQRSNIPPIRSKDTSLLLVNMKKQRDTWQF